ncbi:hypothetical protein ACTXT7_005028 [Hymenolepis weldensis]
MSVFFQPNFPLSPFNRKSLEKLIRVMEYKNINERFHNGILLILPTANWHAFRVTLLIENWRQRPAAAID